MKAISRKGAATCLSVRVQPRSSRSGLSGTWADSLRIALRSAPVDDAANRECCELVAKLLGLPRSDVTVISGRSSRTKLLGIDGLSPEAVEKALAPHLSETGSRGK